MQNSSQIQSTLEIQEIFNKVNLKIVSLDENFDINPYLKWFNIDVQNRILSYYHYSDKLKAFASQLLQRYYLAHFTDLNISDLVIKYNKHHKPYIVMPDNITKQISFNITHSAKYVVLATYSGGDYYIGVDIEQIDNKLNIHELSPIVFSESERSLINNHSDNFFKLWTKKESLIKAIGTGFVTNDYQITQLNLEDLEVTNNYFIITKKLEDYFLSVCLYRK